MAINNRNVPEDTEAKHRDEALQLLKKQRAKIKVESNNFAARVQQTILSRRKVDK